MLDIIENPNPTASLTPKREITNYNGNILLARYTFFANNFDELNGVNNNYTRAFHNFLLEKLKK